MTTDIETIAKEMAALAVDVDAVRVEVDPEDPDEVRTFLAWLSSDLPAHAAESLCRRWAQLIRQSLPDRRDGWSSAIMVIGPQGAPLGVYFLGWAGREDAWDDSEEPSETDSREWHALHRRLDAYLGGRGTSDSQGRGDYFLLDEDHGAPHQSLTIYRIEFLTRDLLQGIQGILRNGFADWSVFVCLDLQPPVDGVASDGIDIHADRIVENWDRTLLAKQLGKRLKV